MTLELGLNRISIVLNIIAIIEYKLNLKKKPVSSVVRFKSVTIMLLTYILENILLFLILK